MKEIQQKNAKQRETHKIIRTKSDDDVFFLFALFAFVIEHEYVCQLR